MEKQTSLTSRRDYYALMCDDSKYYRGLKKKTDYMLMGVYASKKEAQEANKEVKDCSCRHLIKKVKVKLSWV